jgi:predicted acetyltransferase
LEIEVIQALLADKPVIRNLLELYLYEFSAMTGSEVDHHGLYGYEYLDHYWTEAGRHPYLFRRDGYLAGFALVRDRVGPGAEAIHGMAEFFVLRKHRGQGFGRQAAWKIFDLHPGLWQAAEMSENLAAQRFWREVIGEYTRGNYEEIQLADWEGPVQQFRTPGED